ncbi:LLM class flavin-dependent oxidoreductase [Streptomyces radicis]|uniref:LLM class flavin-dependent oxidoreductase n=1 Tax=Streptomyces radicis TaxID=1750517 RepID=A0A3A9VST4_9ACTN|nr:LLM class flavin-dependent oxidoreductase [Streptomyces radicis]RKN03223.1 LLM class flavin-dependent oxidoreductase [Streptomyces radicis]RKN13114.1 LLM class flavin-dependent oxidoreductase [Streptomyces radicis]
MTLHLAVALDGTGWHPAAWREQRARPDELFTARYWADLVAEAESGLLDYVTIEDALALQSPSPTSHDDRTDQVRGRLDAVLIASRVAPLTRHIGLVPTATVSHTEPFHVSKAIATLDHVSSGRAGWRAQVSPPLANAHFGRRAPIAFTELPGSTPGRPLLRPDDFADAFAEAEDFVTAARLLWDSWEDDAEIRDAATERFVDRDKLHYIDFHGRWFSVRGPSIVPRPPQGQPVVAVLAHATVPYRLGAASADLVHVTPRDADDARAIVAEVRDLQRAAGREDETVHIIGDVVVLLGATTAEAEDRRARLDGRSDVAFESDAPVFTGTAAELAELLLALAETGLTGFRLRPAVLPDDLEAITRDLVPELRRRGAFRDAYAADTLRGLLGLPRPANRFATTTEGAAR